MFVLAGKKIAKIRFMLKSVWAREYWKDGISGLAEGDLIFMDGSNQKIKSDHHPFGLPIFQYSNIPPFQLGQRL
jgi:hypothetical protein